MTETEAKQAVKLWLETKANSDGGLVRMDFTEQDYPHVINLLYAAGRNAAVVEGESVKPVEKETAKTPKKTAKAKAS